MTLWKLFEEAAQEHPDKAALIFYGRKLSYLEIEKAANRLCHSFDVLGLKKGDRVAFVAANTPHVPIAFLAAWKMGLVVAAVNPLEKPEAVVANLKLADPKVILVLENFTQHTRAIQADAELSSVRRCRISISAADFLPWKLRLGYKLKNTFKKPANFPKDWKWLCGLSAPGVWSRPSNVPKADDLAVLQFTGGTSGTPKAAMLTHANLVANTDQAIRHINRNKEVVGKDSVFLGVLPFFHVYGLSVCLNMAFTLGSTVVLLPKFEAKEVLSTVQKYQINIFPGIQRMFAALVVSIQESGPIYQYLLSKEYFRHLKLCFSGAGKLNPQTRSAFERFAGCPIVEGYGLSEASPIISVSTVEQNRPGSLGTLVPDTEMKIMDDGELWVRGPQVMKGYWRNEVETGSALPGDGWLATGDIVRQDAEGVLWMIDRKKDMIKVNGENIYPQEIEKSILTCEIVSDAAVIGLPDEISGERVVACVVLKSLDPATDQEREFLTKRIIQHCRELGLKGPSLPAEVRFVDDIPKNIVGKVLKFELKKMFTKSSV